MWKEYERKSKKCENQRIKEESEENENNQAFKSTIKHTLIGLTDFFEES